MSYILDALRKSDQQRRRGTAPTLLAAPAAPVVPRRRALLWYGLFALVLVSAGVVIGLMRPWQQEQEVPVVVAAKPPDQAVNPPGKTPQEGVVKSAPGIPPVTPGAPPASTAPSSADTAASRSAAKSRAATGTQKKAAKPVPARRNTGAGVAKADPARQTPADGSEKTVTPGSDKAMNADEPAPAQTAVPIAALPVAIRKELPPMSIMVHAYSDDPAKRLVGINNHLLHEGDEVAPGLKLEQITRDGMILNFKGYRFRRGAR